MRHRWQGFDSNGQPRFVNGQGDEVVAPCQATLLALGGASWPQLGSDGAWVTELQRLGATVTPLQAANCGFDVGWSAKLAEHAGEPIKPVILHATGPDGQSFSRAGEFVLTATGVEGSLIYAASRLLREAINARARRASSSTCCPSTAPSACSPRSSTRAAAARSAATSRAGSASAASRSRCCTKCSAATRCSTPPCWRAPQAPAFGAQGVRARGRGHQHRRRRRLGQPRRGPDADARGPASSAPARCSTGSPTGGYLLTASFASGRAVRPGPAPLA